MRTSKYGQDKCIFIDESAPANEQRWLVGPAKDGPGLYIQTHDDAGLMFDHVTLRRHGAFIVLEQPTAAGIPAGLPESLGFLRPALVALEKLRLVGIPALPGPVLVNSVAMRRAMELGRFPAALVKTFPKSGAARFFGVDVVWSEDLDHRGALA